MLLLRIPMQCHMDKFYMIKYKFLLKSTFEPISEQIHKCKDIHYDETEINYCLGLIINLMFLKNLLCWLRLHLFDKTYTVILWNCITIENNCILFEYNLNKI